MHSASRIDHQLELAAQPVVTALALEEPSSAEDALTQALRDRADAQGRAAAQHAEPRRAAPLSMLGRPAGWLGYALLGWLLLVLMMPTMPGRGLMRLFMPGLDVAPYSPASFEVAWEPAPPTVGDTVTVQATVTGRSPDQVELVVLDDDLNPIGRRLMTPTEAGYELVFTDLREPVTFHLEAFGRRTRRYTITPDPLPPAERETGTGFGEEGASNEAPREVGGTLRQDDEAQATGDPADAALGHQMGQLAGLVNELSALAERLLEEGDGSGASLQAMSEAIDGLREDAEALAQQLAQAADRGDAGAGEALTDLAEALGSLEIAGLGPPGAAGESGAEGESTARQWREEAAQAARNDAARLAQGLGEAQADIASGLATRAGSDPPPDFRDPAASGGYDETARSGEEGVLPDALMRQVPPSYRARTADYFRRLAQDRYPDADPYEDSP
ncbi:MAG: hypothetical protein ACIAXF_07245 [Phycisphaerales bacterium JB063]